MNTTPNWKAMMEDAEVTQDVLRDVTINEEAVSLTFESGWSFGYEKKLAPDFTPVVGMKVKQWGRGVGSPVRGLMIADKVIYYRTAAEEDERHRKWCEEKERKDKEEYATNQESYHMRIQKLPIEFQRRIRSFEANNPEWGAKFESYELFVCEQAVAIADRVKTLGGIKAFHALPWQEQKRRVPEN